MVNITYSKNQEIRDLLWLYSEAAFFSKMPYDVFYPEISEDVVKKLENDQKDEVSLKKLDEEFQIIFNSEKEIYEKTIETVRAQWQKIEARFINYLKKSLVIEDTYDCFISRYGPGGTFYIPNTVSIRVRKEKAEDLKEANEKIAHEIVHLCINDLVGQHKLEFEDIERMVDIILTKTEIKDLLVNPTMQNFGNPKLDEIFANNNFDIKSTIEEFSKLNQSA